ncbi:efflux RND transporter permease subunit [uncultured Draconibacterium sp.]|uniref:efflux RND transporter permease subunit n=1 Tax=uncultured Draconibacterium sp. TaxID=1573823 RepID=UPI0029C7ED40|nr:efflux RND transporter permease subunit [uncultured Draconibacterium sp.]
MINNIIKFSLNNKYLIILCSVVLVVFGIYTAKNMDIDVFPDLTAPTVIVMTDSHGMAPEEVERLVTYPIETAVNGAMGVRRVRSSSGLGFSFVWVDFDWGTDVYKARQVVSEKLITVQEAMPENVREPILAPQSSVMGEIFFMSLQADTTDLMTLRSIAEWDIQPVILATGGVSQVTIIGGDYKQYQVLADPMKMNFYGVSINELADACREMSQNSTGKIVREHGNEYVVRGVARTSNPEELGNTFIKTVSGKPIRVNDVAQVKIGSAVKMGYASHNAKKSIIISVSKQPKTNTLEVTEQIEQKLEAMKATLPPDVTINTQIFRQADFIETSVNNVQRALLEGAVLVIVILFLFLGSFRTTIISLLAIPLSLLGSVIVLNLFGLNINTMSLGGMTIAIGSLVDDAIIDVENVYKRLRQNFQQPKGERQSAFAVVYEASKEIRASILNATLIIIVAFMPLFFLSGMEGRMLKPLGIAYIVSLFMSLIVAMTLTPLLSKMMLSGDKYLSRKSKESWLARNLSTGYERSLVWVLKHKKVVVLPILGLFVVSLFILSGFGRSFLPEFNEGALTLSIITQPGTSLHESDKLGQLVETEMLSIPEVNSTARRTGRGELDTHSQSTNGAEIDVNFTLDDRELETFLQDVRSKLSGIPGIAFTVGQPLGHRIDHMLSGTRANIAIKLFGSDLNRMFQMGNEIKAHIVDIDGLVDVNVEQQVEIPQIQIRPNRDMLAFYGISILEFNEFVDIALGGEKMADIYEGQQTYDLLLRYKTDYTDQLEGIKNALIDTYDGKKVPLSEVAEVVSASGPNSISRENVKRKLVVSANVAGRDLHSVVEEIKQSVNENIDLPEGYRVEYGGQFESEEKASRMLLLTSIAALFVIFLLLFQEFKNFKLAGIILLNLPLALIGGIFAIMLTSGMLSIPAIIGFITLFGIATRNGILLVSRYQSLEQQGENLYETLVHGSKDRLLPILMTALTAALALIPLAANGDLPGNEIQSPMAQVILGGLLTSTILNIYVVPVVYYALSKNGNSKKNSK